MTLCITAFVTDYDYVLYFFYFFQKLYIKPQISPSTVINNSHLNISLSFKKFESYLLFTSFSRYIYFPMKFVQ